MSIETPKFLWFCEGRIRKATVSSRSWYPMHVGTTNPTYLIPRNQSCSDYFKDVWAMNASLPLVASKGMVGLSEPEIPPLAGFWGFF